MLKNLKKLTVGDINAFDRYRKDMRKKELIVITRELYGDNIPDGEVSRIEREIQSTKNINDNPNVTLDEIQFLIFRSLLKSNPDISLEEVGQELQMVDAGAYFEKIMPTDDKLPTKKKTVRKKKKKDN